RERVAEELRREETPENARTTTKTPASLGAWGRPALAGALFLAVLSVPVWQTWNTMGVSSAVDESSGALSRSEASLAATSTVADEGVPVATEIPKEAIPNRHAARATGE